MKKTNTHSYRRTYSIFRNWLRQYTYIDRIIMNIVRKHRLATAKRTLREINYYPEHRTSILEDYEYSIRITHRGLMQVLNLENVLRYIESRDIEGAFVETGTFTGGASAYALRALSRLRGDFDHRHYWGFDSFEGMPLPTKEDGDHGSVWVTGKSFSEIDFANGTLIGHDTNRADFDQCREYLCSTGYPTEKINLVKGWFQDTLHANSKEIGPIALLRLDGDFYESTKIVYDTLYEQVVKGGIVIIDDYGAFQGCKQATDELLSRYDSPPDLVYVENSIRYFIKP
jgi:O-methyltransferase